ncbi:MAG: hypothetical protein GY866_05900 [Proteobacteria bacterium]|nr:hypothetical protein [Pseudomonadota bacterium]
MEYTNYATIMDNSSMGYVMAAYLVHLVLTVLQSGLVGLLILSGVVNIGWHNREVRLLRYLGLAVTVPEPKRAQYGLIKIGLGLLLLMPLVTGVSYVLSALAGIAALLFLIFQEKMIQPEVKRPGIIMRHALMLVAVICTGFMFYEGADNLALGVDIMRKANKYRIQEMNWQLESDRQSPKVGDLAPDFELADTTGRHQIRLSDFRGRKPVALIFGAHT